jgi:hypothetical protein
MDDKQNPYNDETIHTTQLVSRDELLEREGFNDVIKHYDSVNGFQAPKRLDHFPKPIRWIAKLVVILLVLMFIAAMMSQMLEILDHL